MRLKLLLIVGGLAGGLTAAQAEAVQSPHGSEVFGGIRMTASSISGSQKKIRLQWDYPVNLETPDLIFKLYHSTALASPWTQWELLATLAGNLRSADVNADQPREFFVLTASNFLGESTSVLVPPKTMRLGWDYPVELETPDLVFKVYHSASLAPPPRKWALLTNVPGSQRTVKLPIDKPQEFFVLTASNYLGESDFASR